MATGASTADLADHPDRCAQGRAAADQAPHLHRQHAGRPPHRGGRQQDGPGRLQPRALPRDRGELSGRSPSTLASKRSRRSRCPPSRATTSSRKSEAMSLASRGRRCWSTSRTIEIADERAQCALPPAGAVGEPSEPRFPRLFRHHHLRLGEAGRRGCRRQVGQVSKVKGAWSRRMATLPVAKAGRRHHAGD